LRFEVRRLRERGEVVVWQLPGDADDESGIAYDRALVRVSNEWAVQER